MNGVVFNRTRVDRHQTARTISTVWYRQVEPMSQQWYHRISINVSTVISWTVCNVSTATITNNLNWTVVSAVKGMVLNRYAYDPLGVSRQTIVLTVVVQLSASLLLVMTIVVQLSTTLLLLWNFLRRRWTLACYHSLTLWALSRVSIIDGNDGADSCCATADCCCATFCDVFELLFLWLYMFANFDDFVELMVLWHFGRLLNRKQCNIQATPSTEEHLTT